MDRWKKDTNRKTLRAAGGCPSGHLIVAHSEQFITSFPSSGLKIAIFLLTRPARNRKLCSFYFRVPSPLEDQIRSVKLYDRTTRRFHHFVSFLPFDSFSENRLKCRGFWSNARVSIILIFDDPSRKFISPYGIYKDEKEKHGIIEKAFNFYSSLNRSKSYKISSLLLLVRHGSIKLNTYIEVVKRGQIEV